VRGRRTPRDLFFADELGALKLGLVTGARMPTHRIRFDRFA
jgi:hypothetical protein